MNQSIALQNFIPEFSELWHLLIWDLSLASHEIHLLENCSILSSWISILPRMRERSDVLLSVLTVMVKQCSQTGKSMHLDAHKYKVSNLSSKQKFLHAAAVTWCCLNTFPHSRLFSFTVDSIYIYNNVLMYYIYLFQSLKLYHSYLAVEVTKNQQFYLIRLH